MIYLSAENLTKHYPEQMLFEDLKFSLNKGALPIRKRAFVYRTSGC
jgi:hypothetical protein